MFKLSNLKPGPKARKFATRVGRGPASGKGKTSGRGHKGQNSRAGGGKGPWFEGGQTPLYRRLPKKGFKNPFRVEYQVINLDTISQRFSEGQEITVETLRAAGLVKGRKPVKLLARGKIDKALHIVVDACSKSAVRAVEAAGGSVKLSRETQQEE